MNPKFCVVIRKDNDYIVRVSDTMEDLKQQYKESKKETESFSTYDWSLTAYALGSPACHCIDENGVIVQYPDGWKYYTRNVFRRKGTAVYENASSVRPCLHMIFLDELE